MADSSELRAAAILLPHKDPLEITAKEEVMLIPQYVRRGVNDAFVMSRTWKEHTRCISSIYARCNSHRHLKTNHRLRCIEQ
jgi:hypothetical protein